MTLAALEATLLHYMNGEALSKIPALYSMTMDAKTIKAREEAFKEKLSKARADLTVTIREETSQIGGGSLPDVALKTYVLCIKHKNISAEDLSEQLRTGQTCILTRIQQDEIIMDFRTIKEEEESLLFDELKKIPSN